ncbi:MAG: diacylglycerol kinase family protein [Saprospiraceae bacterium]
MSLRQRFNSFKYAIAGIREVTSSQMNMKIHICCAIIAVLFGFLFSISPSEWCFVIMAIAAVMTAEAFNTAIEHLTDLVSPDHHPLAGKTKDAAAGAVLLTAIGATVVGLLIFLPKILAYITT